MRMTLRQLEYFVAVADGGSVTAASEALRISAPAISTAVSQLEDELGLPLFVRGSRRGLMATAEGLRVLADARTILRLAGQLGGAGRNRGAPGLAGRLAVGALTSLAPVVLPDLCRTFAAAHPALTLDLSEGPQDQLIARIRRGALDVALTWGLHCPPDLKFEGLADLAPRIMLPADHPLAGATAVHLAELADAPYVLLDLPISREYFLSVWQAAAIAPRIAARTSAHELVRGMVANGYGIALTVALPVNARAADGKPIVTLPILDPVPPLALGLLGCAAEAAPVAAFREHCRQKVGPHGVPGMVAPDDPPP
jgi:DNA-binding transcriptional LysR family regulator